MINDQPGAETWPIAASTWVLMQQNAVDPAASKEALKFFAWAYKNGKADAASLDYIPIPDQVTTTITGSWSDIKGPNGAPVWP